MQNSSSLTSVDPYHSMTITMELLGNSHSGSWIGMKPEIQYNEHPGTYKVSFIFVNYGPF